MEEAAKAWRNSSGVSGARSVRSPAFVLFELDLRLRISFQTWRLPGTGGSPSACHCETAEKHEERSNSWEDAFRRAVYESCGRPVR